MLTPANGVFDFYTLRAAGNPPTRRAPGRTDKEAPAAMDFTHSQPFKPNLLCIAPPPFSPTAPPAGAAYLLGYLKSRGCHDFDFLDLRLGVPDAYSPTYSYTGAFAEAYVHDIPDLPLVLMLVKAFERGEALTPERSALLERFCLERGISLGYLHNYLTSLERYLTHVFDRIPDIRFIGFTVWTTNYLSTLLAAAILKRRKNPPFIAAGGPQVTSSPASAEIALRSGLFDLVGLGEGEETLLEIYNGFQRDGRVGPGIPGTLAKGPEGEFLRTPRALMRLTALPTPSFAEMHLAAYQTDGEHLTVPLQFSRGCTDKCAFCSEWKFWERFRTDTAEHTVEQIERVKRDYGATFIIFMDSLLNGIPRRLVQLCELMVKHDTGVRWGSFMRAQMDGETAKLLAQSGCHDVFVGVESFSDETLDLMNKRRTSADNLQAVQAFLDAGIDVTAGFVPGFPGDSRQRFIGSALILRDMLERYRGRFEIHDEAFVVQPGAPIHAKLDEMGLVGKPWAEDYLDLAPDYRDITSRIFCTVEGASQGLERVGRLSILRTITEDSQANSGFAFVRAENEVVSANEFGFTHLYGGWHLLTRKSRYGQTYGLIVSADEEAELQDLDPSEMWETNPEPSAILDRIEAEHIVPPSRSGMRVVRGLYRRTGGAGCRYAVSPFVVVRPMDWRHDRRILMCSVQTEQCFQEKAEDGELLRFVYQAPRSEDEMWQFCRRRGMTRAALRKTVAKLKENGILVICDMAEAHETRAAADPVAESVAAE